MTAKASARKKQMSRRVILLIDDNPEDLQYSSTALEQAGYHVLTASTTEQAEELLCNERIHLSIHDIEMRSGGKYPSMDTSGLTLARDRRFRWLPKIILTGHPHFEFVRTALTPSNEGPSAAVNFVAKREGSIALIDAVNQAFDNYLRLNWDLVIQPNEERPFSLLNVVEINEPALTSEQLVPRTREMEDLFRRLFYQYTEIKTDRLLWHREHRVALTVFAYSEEKLPQSYLVICGNRDPVMAAAERFKKYHPRSGDLSDISLEESAETTHFAGHCYVLNGANFDNLESLKDIYGRTTNYKTFSSAVGRLLGKTLANWHQEKRVIEETEQLDEMYPRVLRLNGEQDIKELLEDRVKALARRMSILGARVDLSDEADGVRIDFNGDVFTYPNPLAPAWDSFDPPSPFTLLNTPGNVSADTVLSDGSGRLWVTDFANAGLAPAVWNHVAIEAVVRFDLTSTTKGRWLHQLEQTLTEGEFSRFFVDDLESPVKKPAQIIEDIRKDASATVGREEAAYNLGLFFEAASRLAGYDPGATIQEKELARFAHLFMAMCVIGARINSGESEGDTGAQHSEEGIIIDSENRKVWVNGVRVKLVRNGYALLCYLYDRANKHCTRKELIERVFGEEYYANGESQDDKLTTAIHRLRASLHDDPKRPIYLITESGGYRLVPKPKQDKLG